VKINDNGLTFKAETLKDRKLFIVGFTITVYIESIQEVYNDTKRK
jgi:hypothetical protein